MDTLYHLALLVFSIIAIPYHGYPYCFHLLHFAYGNADIANVLLAINTAGSQLLWVGLLLMIIMFNYTLFAFAFFRHMFNSRHGIIGGG